MPTRFFADDLMNFGSQPAIVTEDGQSLSYRELVDAADAFAATLGQTRRLLLIEAAQELAPLVAYLGALRARHPVILTAPGASAKDRRLIETYRPHATYRKADGAWILDEAPSQEALQLHDELALLLSTSGSTGSAKLVRLSRLALDSNARAIVTYLALTASERAITSLPWHYSYGLSVVHSHLACGATLLLTDSSVVDRSFWSLFDRQGGTSFAGVPHTFELLERIGFRDMGLPSLRSFTVAGGRLPPERVLTYAGWARERGVRFFVMYGQTEAAPRIAYVPPELLEAYPDCIGQPIPGGSLRLLDETGVEVEGVEAVGQLAYRGPNVMMGYATARHDLARGADLDELLTGDLATRNADGLYRIVGRASRFSKIFGLRINLDEVEEFLGRQGIRAAVAGDDRTLAVCLLNGTAPDTVRMLLARQFVLSPTVIGVYAADDLPLLPSGKVDYRMILSRAAAPVAEHTPLPPVAPDIQNEPGDRRSAALPLREAYAWALGRASIEDQDSFVSLGGDSLSFVQVSMAIEDRLGAVPESWEAMPIRALERLEMDARDRAEEPGRLLPSALRRLDMEILLRALAILGVVFTHASRLDVGGGSSLLLVLAGLAFARFQREKLLAGGIGAALSPFVARVLVPYYGVVIAYELLRQQVDLPRLLLISNFWGRLDGFLQIYWFIELLFQCMILLSLAFLVPPFRRAATERPWATGFALLVGAIGVRVLSTSLFDRHSLDDRVPDMLMYLFLYGWCLCFTQSASQRWAMTAVAFLVFPFGVLHGSEAVWLLVGTSLMLWMPHLLVQPPARTALAAVSSASFYIYLTHGVILYVLIHVLHWDTSAGAIMIGMLLSVGTGLAAQWAFQKASFVLDHWTGSRKRRFAPAEPV